MIKSIYLSIKNYLFLAQSQQAHSQMVLYFGWYKEVICHLAQTHNRNEKVL